MTSHDSNLDYFYIHKLHFCGFAYYQLLADPLGQLLHCIDRRLRVREANGCQGEAHQGYPVRGLQAPPDRLVSILGTGGLKLDGPGGVSGTQEFQMPRNAQTTR